jgi:hypothetical protein
MFAHFDLRTNLETVVAIKPLSYPEIDIVLKINKTFFGAHLMQFVAQSAS